MSIKPSMMNLGCVPNGFSSTRARLLSSSYLEAHSRHLLAASPQTDASHLAASFVEFDLGAMPIVDAEDALIGIVTRTDLLRLLISGAHIERWA